MENSFRSIIDSAASILILLPTKPYFDQVAAGLALYLALREKKDTSISAPVPMTVEFNRLVGVNKVTNEFGNKNLTIAFAGYKATDIERVSYDIENGEFRLAVIPKPGFPSPKKEQVQFSYSGVSADTIILIGGANESHFPQLVSKDLLGAKLVHIGTRALSSDKAVMSFARPASSVSELVASLINESGLAIDPDIATNLVAGIEEGSKDFKGPDVTPETFEVVAQLLRAGGQRIPISASTVPGQPLVAHPQPDLPIQAEKKEEPTPKDWLEPKIYKGTSIS